MNKKLYSDKEALRVASHLMVSPDDNVVPVYQFDSYTGDKIFTNMDLNVRIELKRAQKLGYKFVRTDEYTDPDIALFGKMFNFPNDVEKTMQNLIENYKSKIADEPPKFRNDLLNRYKNSMDAALLSIENRIVPHKVDKNTYLVKKSESEDKFYVVRFKNHEIYCNCKSGLVGKHCKHKSLVETYKYIQEGKVSTPNLVENIISKLKNLFK